MLGNLSWRTLQRGLRTAAPSLASRKPFHYEPTLKSEGNKGQTEFKKLPGSEQLVEEVKVSMKGKEQTVLRVEGEALRLLSSQAMADIAHLLRPSHLSQLASILKDPEASSNDRFVALELLKNANVAAGMVLPGCQDTGTAIVIGKKGQGLDRRQGRGASFPRGLRHLHRDKPPLLPNCAP